MILEVLGFSLIFFILFILSMVFENLSLMLIKVTPELRKSILFGIVMVSGMGINFFVNNTIIAVLTFFAGFYVFHKTYDLRLKETVVAYLLWVVMWLILASIISFITLRIV